jgi:hypothetical protein
MIMACRSLHITLVAAFGCLIGLGDAKAGNCNVGGPWDFTQDNGQFVKIELTQGVEGKLDGSAVHQYSGMRGIVANGLIIGRAMQFSIDWDNGSVGSYLGYVEKDNKAHGWTFDAKTGEDTAWGSGIRIFTDCP